MPPPHKCTFWEKELESDLKDTVDWNRKWLTDFNAGKAQLVLFDQSNNTGAIDVKMDVPVLEETSSFKMLGLHLSFFIIICNTKSTGIMFLIYLVFLSLIFCYYYFCASKRNGNISWIISVTVVYNLSVWIL